MNLFMLLLTIGLITLAPAAIIQWLVNVPLVNVLHLHLDFGQAYAIFVLANIIIGKWALTFDPSGFEGKRHLTVKKS